MKQQRALFLLLVSLLALLPSAYAFRDSLDIKIGQMILMGVDERTALADTDPLCAELKEGKIGGVVLFEKNISSYNSRVTLKKLVNDLQRNALIPLFVSIDEEGGKVHRLKEKYGFPAMPSAAYLGKLDNPDSTLYYNRRLSAAMHQLGINLNYAPDVDIAVNPTNPVIVKKERSFSPDAAIVSKHALLCIQAHHEYSIKTILKHFPGHGSSDADSHLGIVDVSDSWDLSELAPYNTILKAGQCDAIMTAHIINRRWDTSMLPATLSAATVGGLVRGLLGFRGVVFSDDMQMHAISRNYGLSNAIRLCINAGVDVLLFANSSKDAKEKVTASEIHAQIRQMVQDGSISRERIDLAYRRIMRMKADFLRS
jgi:beta-N-acetylhexosaminidase